MNKDFKTILILGIISIIISGLGIYTLRDVKFRNTKRIQEKKIDIEEQEAQKLLDEYNSLVDVYIPTITDKAPENDLQKTGNITLLIPGFLENEGFEILTDKLAQDEINVSIKQIDSLSEYENEIKTNLKSYDIALVPLNWTNNLSLESINLGENIKPYFIELFSDNLNSSENTIIPFAIDPAITMYKSGIPEKDSWSKIFSYIIIRNTSKKYSMPIIWGEDEMIENMIKNNIDPFENYSELLYLQQAQTEEAGVTEENHMINANNVSSTSKYTYINQKNLINILKNQNKYCEIFPATCIMYFGYSDIKFGFLSDLDIIDKYFQGNNKLYVGNFTDTQESYPVKGRVFVVPKGNENINLSKEFFNRFISEGLDGTEFRNHTLSAITNFYDNQKTKQEFREIIKNESKFFIFD